MTIEEIEILENSSIQELERKIESLECLRFEGVGKDYVNDSLVEVYKILSKKQKELNSPTKPNKSEFTFIEYPDMDSLKANTLKETIKEHLQTIVEENYIDEDDIQYIYEATMEVFVPNFFDVKKEYIK